MQSQLSAALFSVALILSSSLLRVRASAVRPFCDEAIIKKNAQMSDGAAASRGQTIRCSFRDLPQILMLRV